MDPRLKAFAGRQFPTEKGIFGLFADASNDRWGRMLMNKRERLLAHKESSKPQKLYDSDYLLVVYDEGRMRDLSSLINHLDLAVRHRV